MPNKKIKEFKLMTREEIIKARAERDSAIKNMRSKLAEIKLKENALKNEIASEKRKNKISNEKNRKVQKIKLEKQLQSIKKNKESVKEDINANREKVRLLSAEIRNKNILIKKDFIAKKRAVKLEALKRRDEDRKKILELKKEEAERKNELMKEVQAKKAKMTEEIVENYKKISDKKVQIIKAEEELKNERKKLQEEKLLEKQKLIADKRAEEEQLKMTLKKLKSKIKVVEHDVQKARNKEDAVLEKDLLKRKELFEKEKDLITNSLNKMQEKAEDEIIEAEAGTVNLVEFEDIHPSQIGSDETISVIEKQDNHNFKLNLISEYGKNSIKLFNKAEEASDQTTKAKFMKNPELYEKIVAFEEHSPKSIHIKSLIKYIYVLNDWKIDEERIDMLYQSQLIAILYGNPVQLGDGYVQATVVKRARIARYKRSIDKTPSSIFDDKVSKDYNEIINKKLNDGSPIKIGEGLIIYREKNGSIVAMQDSNFTGA